MVCITRALYNTSHPVLALHHVKRRSKLKHRANEGGPGGVGLPEMAKDTIYISREQEQIWGIIQGGH